MFESILEPTGTTFVRRSFVFFYFVQFFHMFVKACVFVSANCCVMANTRSHLLFDHFHRGAVAGSSTSWVQVGAARLGDGGRNLPPGVAFPQQHKRLQPSWQSGLL